MIATRFVWAALLCASVVAAGCAGPGFNLPPADRLAGPGPGVDGPGPGVWTPYESGMIAAPPNGAGVAFGGPSCAPGGAGFGGNPFAAKPSSQVMFVKPEGMQVAYDVTGTGQFGETPLVTPARLNFRQPGLYRMKLTNIENHEGVELYPTLEIGPVSVRNHAFLAHNTVPIQFTVDDFNQILSGNYVTKVIYLPDPEFQELAVAGVETLVSTRLDPGVDPIVEADRRGSILAVLRVGNKDIEMPGAETELISNIPGSIANCAPTMAPGAGFGGPSGIPQHIAGLSTVPYGMPITGTPIGLPGPPHIPMGGPAGLQKHEIHNHTHQYVPDPARKIKIHVKQHPGIRYPEPRTRAWIHEYNNPNCAHCVGTQTTP